MAEIPSREAIESCIYCGQEANTRDHVPPKCLFAKPRPPMITVPACLACNKSYEKDDVLLAIATWGEAYIEHPQAMRVWQESLGPLLRRSPRFSAMLASNIMPGTTRTPTGLYSRIGWKFKSPNQGSVVPLSELSKGCSGTTINGLRMLKLSSMFIEIRRSIPSLQKSSIPLPIHHGLEGTRSVIAMP